MLLRVWCSASTSSPALVGKGWGCLCFPFSSISNKWILQKTSCEVPDSAAHSGQILTAGQQFKINYPQPACMLWPCKFPTFPPSSTWNSYRRGSFIHPDHVALVHSYTCWESVPKYKDTEKQTAKTAEQRGKKRQEITTCYSATKSWQSGQTADRSKAQTKWHNHQNAMGDVNQEQLLPWNPTPSCRGRGAGRAASVHGQQPHQNLWQEVTTPHPIPPAPHSLAGDQRRSTALRSQGTGNYFWSGGKHTTLFCLQGNKTGQLKHNSQRKSTLRCREQQPAAASSHNREQRKVRLGGFPAARPPGSQLLFLQDHSSCSGSTSTQPKQWPDNRSPTPSPKVFITRWPLAGYKHSTLIKSPPE